MADNLNQYTADTIVTLENLAHVRARPTSYIQYRDSQGITHTYFELISNSMDELAQRPEGGTIYVGIARNRVKNNFTCFVVDDGRGIPADKLSAVMTKLNTSGKISSKSAYKHSGGLLGLGAKVSAALSTRFRATARNLLDGGNAASVYLENGDDKHKVEWLEKADIPVGTAVVSELDMTFFPDGSDFMTSGYLSLVNLCKELNIFNENINFQFYHYDIPFPEEYWKADIAKATSILADFINSNNKVIEYSSSDTPDKSAYLFQVWNLTSDITYRDRILKYPEGDDRLGYDIRIFLTKSSNTTNAKYFISVNNVNLPNKTDNSVTNTFMEVLANKIANLQETEEYREFVKENYSFPILALACGVNYNGAEFAGATKTGFKDKTFEDQFRAELNYYFDNNPTVVEQIGKLLASNINLWYSRFYDTPMKKSDVNRVFMTLNYPGNYKECKSSDASKCELFIVEGSSASVNRVRDNEFQAVYETRGKPLNATIDYSNISESRKRILQDPIYQDLIKILGVTPNTTDMSVAKFGKIIIATDADPDGYHIRALHINNFYIINPRIVESGMIWVANPPLYSMAISSKSKLHLCDRVALMDARIKFLYEPSFEVSIDSVAGVKKLEGECFREFCYIVKELGEKFEVVSKQLNIPICILERLTLGIDLIYPSVNYGMLSKLFKSDDPTLVSAKAFPNLETLLVSIRNKDYPISLNTVGQIIVDQLLGSIRKFQYSELMPIIRTKFKGSAYEKPHRVSMMYVYEMMKSFDALFRVDRYKGLGKLSAQDCSDAVTNPATRSITQITNVGDVIRNFNLLNKGDSTARKELMMDSTAVNTKFKINQRIQSI